MASPELISLINAASPGARVVRTKRLRGGVGSSMRVVYIERADGGREKVSVRRLRPDKLKAEPRALEYEFEVLQLLERVGISAPRPLHLDAQGKHFGDPALVMTFLPGRPNVAPLDTTAWADALAAGVLEIHSVTPDTADLSWLRKMDNRQRIQDIADCGRSDELSDEVLDVLRHHCDRIEPLQSTLIHGDYWSGNTIWNRGRLTGVIDWTNARLGDRRHDVSACRDAMVFDHDREVADQFLAAYERRAGYPLPDVWFFDLIRAVVAYLWHDDWLEGTGDLGIKLDAEAVKARLAAFLRHAIERSS
jgi:aminoglycoside phosphotransferase (APT) family kinase protein